MTLVVLEHGHSLVIPPHFDGKNYAYWKIRIKAFFKSIDERVWNFIEYGWEKSTIPISKWSTSLVEVHRSSAKFHGLFFPVFIHRILLDLGLEDFPASEPIHIIAPIGATFLR